MATVYVALWKRKEKLNGQRYCLKKLNGHRYCLIENEAVKIA